MEILNNNKPIEALMNKLIKIKKIMKINFFTAFNIKLAQLKKNR